MADPLNFPNRDPSGGSNRTFRVMFFGRKTKQKLGTCGTRNSPRAFELRYRFLLCPRAKIHKRMQTFLSKITRTVSGTEIGVHLSSIKKKNIRASMPSYY